MRVLDIINMCVNKVGLAQSNKVPNDLYDLALQLLNSAYFDVWNIYPFRDQKLVGVTVSLTADTSEVVLPQEIDTIRAVRTANDPIFPVGEIMLDNFAPDSFEDTGAPTNFWNLADIPLTAQLSSATTVTLVSDDADDKNLVVRVFGEVDSEDAREDIVLTGTTEATGTLSFTKVYSISKPYTQGRITVKDSGSNEIGSIPPWSDRSIYRRIRIYPIPDDAYTLYVDALRRWPRLTHKSDTILLTRAEPAVRSLFLAELYEYVRDDARAQAERAKARDQLEIATVREEHIDEEDTSSYPYLGMFGDSRYPLDLSETGTGRRVY